MAADLHPFEYQRPDPKQIAVIASLRQRCAELYSDLMALPESRERSLAITKLEEVSMWANKCVAFRLRWSGDAADERADAGHHND